MKQNDTDIFYIPFLYLSKIRLDGDRQRILSWWFLWLVPTLGYYVLAMPSIGWRMLCSYFLLTITALAYYELGYMFNDTYTTQREVHPTLRLDQEQSMYFYHHAGLLVGIRLMWVLGLLCLYGWLENWTYTSLLTIAGILLLLPLFTIYNHIRGVATVIFYPILVGWRYLVLLLPALGSSHWWSFAILLLLSYPMEISIERWSMPRHRYGMMARVLPNERSKQPFRAWYYAVVLATLSPVWIAHWQWCMPILLMAVYRWIRVLPRKREKTIDNK